MKAFELKVPPVALVAIVAASMWAVSRISPNLYFAIPGAAWLSAGIAMAGVCIAMLGVVEFRAAGTTVDPRVPDQSVNLVVRGVYRHSRNPMYVGFLLVLCAWGLSLGWWRRLILSTPIEQPNMAANALFGVVTEQARELPVIKISKQPKGNP